MEKKIALREWVRALTVQDGFLEAEHLGESRVDVQWVVVARQAVQLGLGHGREGLLHGVRLAIGHLHAL